MSALIELVEGKTADEMLLNRHDDLCIRAKAGNLVALQQRPITSSSHVEPDILERELKKLPEVNKVYLVSEDRNIAENILYDIVERQMKSYIAIK